jgi:hypothetical protein
MCERVCFISVVALLFGTPASDAALLTKELTRVHFEDGGSATGFLMFDSTSNQVEQFDIRTTLGSSIESAFEYRSDTARIAGQSNVPGGGWPNSFLQLVSLPQNDGSASRQLLLAFSTPLLAGESSSILYESGLGRNSYERQFIGQHLQNLRVVSGPELLGRAAVPETSESLWLALGVGVLFGVHCVKRRHNLS